VKYLILFVLALALVACIPCEAEAGCGLFARVGAVRSNAQARRAEGRGLARLRPANWRLFGCN
jgi:hypothetical protein